MCGRFTQTATMAEMCALLAGLEIDLSECLPDYNVAPTQDIVTILNQPPLRAVRTAWGIPSPHGKRPLINARAETLADKPSFRGAFQERRCLIPAGGFYEWQHRGAERIPWYFRPRSPGLFCFAGLWQPFDGRRCSVIITTEANASVRPIHDRMPVILAPAQYAAWLDGNADFSTLSPMLVPYPADAMTGFAVTDRIHTLRNRDAACILPRTEEQTLF